MEVRTELLKIEPEGHILVGQVATADVPDCSTEVEGVKIYEGCLIYDTTLNKLFVCNGTAWEQITSASE